MRHGLWVMAWLQPRDDYIKLEQIDLFVHFSNKQGHLHKNLSVSNNFLSLSQGELLQADLKYVNLFDSGCSHMIYWNNDANLSNIAAS